MCLNGMEVLRWRAGGARVSVDFVRSSVGQGCKDPLASAVQPAHLSKVNNKKPGTHGFWHRAKGKPCISSRRAIVNRRGLIYLLELRIVSDTMASSPSSSALNNSQQSADSVRPPPALFSPLSTERDYQDASTNNFALC